MDIRNSTEGLKTLLGVPSTNTAQPHSTRTTSSTGASTLTGDTATFSTAGTEVLQAASASGVRADKVAAVQAALASGTYDVPASAVAGKVVDVMLGDRSSGN